MLKIWLTWLQPSLGVLGTALVLSNPLCSNAAPKPVAVSNTSKIPAKPPMWSGMKSAGTTIERELAASGVAVTPDFAVRQLAIGSMATSGMRVNSLTATTPQTTLNPLANFAPPGKKAKNSLAKLAKTVKPQRAKQPVAALARKIEPQAAILVPGLFIGNADVRLSNRFLPVVKPIVRPISLKPLARPISAAKPTAQELSSMAEIGAPTPLSAMMAAKTAVDPFPVVRPELMQKLGNSTVASIPAIKSAPYALNPIAAIPSGIPQAKAPKVVLPATAPQSLDPIAAIPSGLQRLLGNNLDSQPTVAMTPVATAKMAKSSSVVALKQLVSPTDTVASASAIASSLQLATSQAYTSVPKFDIPGETILAAKPVKPAANVLVVKRVQKDLAIAVVARKSNYVSLMSDRQLTPATKQSWTNTTGRNNLGGLILGSQTPSTLPKVVSLLPMNTSNASTFTGDAIRDMSNIN
jgi:hypothetical protein